MDVKNSHCQYFIDGFWQPCKLLDFYSGGRVGIIYSIEFKSCFINAFASEIRFLNGKSEELIIPLPNKNMDSKVVFH